MLNEYTAQQCHRRLVIEYLNQCWNTGIEVVHLLSYTNLIRTAKEAGIKARIIDTVTTKVVNLGRGDKYDVYIGRGSVFGNPYAIGFSGDREEVIRKFKYDFEREFLRFTRVDVLKLKGKTLGCHCKPAACHGDVIAKYLNALDDES